MHKKHANSASLSPFIRNKFTFIANGHDHFIVEVVEINLNGRYEVFEGHFE